MKLQACFCIFAFILAYWAFEMKEGWKDQCHLKVIVGAAILSPEDDLNPSNLYGLISINYKKVKR